MVIVVTAAQDVEIVAKDVKGVLDQQVVVVVEVKPMEVLVDVVDVVLELISPLVQEVVVQFKGQLVELLQVQEME